jgi:hypothetical protein
VAGEQVEKLVGSIVVMPFLAGFDYKRGGQQIPGGVRFPYAVPNFISKPQLSRLGLFRLVYQSIVMRGSEPFSMSCEFSLVFAKALKRFESISN